MNKLLIPILFLVVISCSDGDDPKPAACQPTSVEFFDKTSNFFYFDSGIDGFNILSSISVDDGTDSAYQYTYEYTDNQLSRITNTSSSVNYTPEFDGDKLITLSGRLTGQGIVGEEVRISYTGNNISRLDYFFIDANSGDLYQYLHSAFSYDDGDLVSYSYNYDLVTLFALAFQQTPTEPYSPELLYTMELEYGNENAPNPLLGQFNLFRPELSMGANLPINLIQRDGDGNFLGSLGYTLTFNEQGFPIFADGGDSFIDLSYECN